MKFSFSENTIRFWIKFTSAFTLLFGVWILLSLFTFSAERVDTSDDDSYWKEFSSRYAVYAIDFPHDLSFAGEKVPLHDFDVYESLDREFLVNSYWHSQAFLFLKRANRYFPVIEPILKKNSIPDDFKYLCVAESGLTNAVSPSGAAGFWQLLKATGVKYNLEINDEIDERFHLEKSTEAACKYLNESYSVYHNWALVAASYNAGMGGIDNQIKKQKVASYYDLLLNEETSRYVFRIIALKAIMANPLHYGFHYRKKDMYPPLKAALITPDSTINDLASYALTKGINYKLLKYFNPWLMQNSLTRKEGKKYQIRIPSPENRDLDKLWAESGRNPENEEQEKSE